MGANQSSAKPAVATSDKNNEKSSRVFSHPSEMRYDQIDKVASQLPHFIDDESRQQVEDFKQACDDGKGPMVACFSTAEFISLFERKHKEAADLYRNVCFRPLSDKSPNRVQIDGSMAYPAGCFNLAKMLMTGKGIEPNRVEAYKLFDRACKAGHGGSCFTQAQILCAPPGSLAEKIPHDPQKAMTLYEQNCEKGDSLSCYTLASMLLRGDKVNKFADNVSPDEARGKNPVQKRPNEEDRSRSDAEPYVVPRDPKRAEKLLTQACLSGHHVTSCHNLAVMYTVGDEGVPVDEEKATKFKKLTDDKISLFGGF